MSNRRLLARIIILLLVPALSLPVAGQAVVPVSGIVTGPAGESGPRSDGGRLLFPDREESNGRVTWYSLAGRFYAGRDADAGARIGRGEPLAKSAAEGDTLSVDSTWFREAGYDPRHFAGFISMSGQTRVHDSLQMDLKVADIMAEKPWAVPMGNVQKTAIPWQIFVGGDEGHTVRSSGI